jgi:hypothetical protein
VSGERARAEASRGGPDHERRPRADRASVGQGRKWRMHRESVDGFA